MLGIILGPPSNEVACTAGIAEPTHLAIHRGTRIDIIPIADAIAGTGSWTKLADVSSGGASGFRFDLKNKLLFYAQYVTSSPRSITIRKIGFDGTGETLVFSAAPSSAPLGSMDINTKDKHIYLTNPGTGVQVIDYDGNAVTSFSSPNSPNSRPNIYYDEVNELVFWSEPVGGEIYKANPDGSDTSQVVDLNNAGNTSQMDGDGESLFTRGNNPNTFYEIDIGSGDVTEVSPSFGNIGAAVSLAYDASRDIVFGVASSLLWVWQRDSDTISIHSNFLPGNSQGVALLIVEE